MKYQMTLKNVQSIIVAGIPGAGKTTFIHSFLKSQIDTKTPNKLQIIYIDIKAIGAMCYRDLPHLVAPIACYSSDAFKQISWVYSQFEERKKAVIEKGANPDNWPYILVVIDEIADIYSESGTPKVELSKLARLGRQYKILFLAATQYPTADVIDTQFLRAMATKIAFQLDNATASRTVIGESGAERLPKHSALCRFNGLPGLHKKRFPMAIEEKVIPAYVEQLKARYGDAEYLFSAPDNPSIDDEIAAKAQAVSHLFADKKAGQTAVNNALIRELGKGVGPDKRKLIANEVNRINGK